MSSAAPPIPRSPRPPRPPDPNALGHHGHGGQTHEPTGHGEGGPASKRIITAYGFWIFLLSDIVMFSAFFATYAVQREATAGGPSGHDLFDLRIVAWETAALLLSSFVCGLASLASFRKDLAWTETWLLVTGLLGFAFVALELREFAHMIAIGAGPQRSGFLSAFFALVGCHGLHVSAGLLWLGTMMAQIKVKGFRPPILRRLACFYLFWHALDIIWVGIFTIVYLIGAGA
ncbi:MAG TPA: cytochrome o ubiquinol oxidase subunit III [Allosphingosinicella sp.]|jgi:cytochrome o ubiquinol oxidase subunit 3